jgi:hypothetical protein
MRKRLFAMLIFPMLLFSVQGFAQAKSQTVGNWLVGTYITESGQFDYCLGAASFAGGTSLGFLVNQQYYLSVLVLSPNWSLPLEEIYPVAMTVDATPTIKGNARVYLNNAVTIFVENTRDFAAKLKSGRVLYVQTGEQNLSFGLQGSRRAIDATINCVAQGLAENAPPSPSNPFVLNSGKNPFAPAGGETAASDNIDATLFMTEILKEARIGSYNLVPVGSRVQGYEAMDVVWRTKNTIGFLNRLPIMQGVGAQELEAALKRVAMDQCDSAVKIETNEREFKDGRIAFEIFQLCEYDDSRFRAAYGLMPFKNGEYFLINHVSADRRNSAKKVHNKILRAIDRR